MPPLFIERTLTARVKQEIAFRQRQWHALLLAAKGQRKEHAPALVFTTSRSGSTWLCELLLNINQSGPLPEHIRPHHFKYAIQQTNGRDLLRDLLHEAAVLIQEKRYSGSKLIWDYFPTLFSESSVSGLKAMLAPLFDLEPICIRLRRRDIVAQAVSRYVSTQTGVYHTYRGSRRPSSDVREQIVESADPNLTYNMAEIKRHERILQCAESHLDARISDLGPAIYEIVYEDLLTDPSAVLQPLVARLRPRLSPKDQVTLLHNSLRNARVARNENVLQSNWLARYRAERKS